MFNRVGPMACAILLAVLYRQLFGYPERIRAGIQFSSKQLLRFAIYRYTYSFTYNSVNVSQN